LTDLSKKVADAYEKYEYHVVYHSLYQFCIQQMSAFYLDIIKDRLYVSHPKSTKRRSAQTVLFRILNQLVRLAAPIFTFTCEEVWKEMPTFARKEDSVHLAEFEKHEREWLTAGEKEDWTKIANSREIVLKLMEEARQQKLIGSSLEA